MARRGGSPEQLLIGIAILMFFVISVIIQKIRAASPISIILFIVITVSFGLLVYLLIKALKPNQKQTAELRSPSFNNSLHNERRPPQVYVEPEVTGQQRADCDYQQQPNFDSSYIRRQSPQETQEAINRDWDVSILKEIEWKRFEKICTEYLKMAGYVAQETNVGADGGVDIHVRKPSDENFKGIVQCKAWNTYKVGVKPIRELFGIMAADQISTGILLPLLPLLQKPQLPQVPRCRHQ
ncbi:MAG: restriction endonuclease [Prolixibacteraceae bacterium]|nr:restriction endonuclease [Prolixibacteraceae bacterium]MDD2856522.1 restriction endonuclease [Desulfuromonadaceae bacterium]